MSDKTDKEKVLDLLNELGVGHENDSAMLPSDDQNDHGDIWLNVGSSKIVGYGGFSAIFLFDDKGGFVTMSIGEE